MKLLAITIYILYIDKHHSVNLTKPKEHYPGPEISLSQNQRYFEQSHYHNT